MRILILNWRDIRHPRKGGAEVLTHGFAKRLVDRGHQIEWFTGGFQGGIASELIDGMTVHRGGNALSVRWHAYEYYRKNGPYDIVIDEINTIPFFAPRYAPETVAFVCQLAREVWFYESRQPISTIGYAIEPLYLSGYRQVPTLSISQSSAKSLRDIGFRGEIGVMPMAIDQYETPAPRPLESRSRSVIALNRITRSKRIDHMIEALALLPPALQDIRLQIVGSGPSDERRRLEALAESLGIGGRIEWLGYVDEKRKRELLAGARALLMTSVREGWGLAVTEANLAGTPAIAYDVPGLRDSVRNAETGYLAAPNPRSLAERLELLLADAESYGRIASRAQASACGMTWQATTDFVEGFLGNLSL